MKCEPSDRISLGGAAPAHVAIIMDGNGRWAETRGLPRSAGHRRGAEALRHAVSAAIELGISYLTVYAFSSENWKRPADEVDGLMGLLRWYLRAEIAELHKNGVRMRFIGERSHLPADVMDLIGKAETRTADNEGLVFVVALSYGGRQELVTAVRRLAEAVEAGQLDPSDIDERRYAAELGTAGIPDPDLIIRTGGEQRISNFLLWQSAYTELLFLDTLWPDFSKEDLAKATHEYQNRRRRYGAAIGAEKIKL